MNNLYFIAPIAIIAGTICTFLIKTYAIRKGIVNNPNPIVPQHTKPIAYLGGVGIFGGIIITTLIISLFFRDYFQQLDSIAIKPLLAGATAFLVFGTLDDLKTYSPKQKFLWQTILATISVCLGIKGSFFNVYGIDFFLSVLWIVTIVNAVNLTDVCDGLIGGLCFIIFLFVAFFNPHLHLFAIITAGSILGFLFFNLPKASIFSGDAGAHLLGFLLASICLLGLPITASLPERISWMLLVPGVMLFELFFLIVVRTQKGLKWWKGSPDHFSLRLQAAGFSRWQTDIIAWLFQTLFLTIVYFMYKFTFIGQGIICFALLLLLFLGWKYLRAHEVKPKQ